MTGGPTDERIAARFAAVVGAAGGADAPDWLATAVTDSEVRDRLAALATAVTDADAGPDYGPTLTPADRADAGQFATHPGIATALCRWAITPRSDRLPRVLNPAVGTGVFVRAAADRLAALAPDADSAARLYEADFFDTTPDTEPADRADRDTYDALTLGRFDAVVGNPPYLRQETVDADRVRAHLDAFGPPGDRPYRDGDRALSNRSDAYVYFVTHATQFLRPGGRLAVVVPAKWLTTRYGGPFQRFLFDHYRLHAVVGFGARAFDDALVDTVLLFAERLPDPARRQATPVRFHRLDDQVSVSLLLAVLADSPPPLSGPFAVSRTETGRTVTVRQGRFADRESDKLAPYLDAAVPFVRPLLTDGLVPLSTLGTVKRGVMTGANDFFSFQWGIPLQAIQTVSAQVWEYMNLLIPSLMLMERGINRGHTNLDFLCGYRKCNPHGKQLRPCFH
jgi:hypothetical protein